MTLHTNCTHFRSRTVDQTPWVACTKYLIDADFRFAGPRCGSQTRRFLPNNHHVYINPAISTCDPCPCFEKPPEPDKEKK